MTPADAVAVGEEARMKDSDTQDAASVTAAAPTAATPSCRPPDVPANSPPPPPPATGPHPLLYRRVSGEAFGLLLLLLL